MIKAEALKMFEDSCPNELKAMEDDPIAKNEMFFRFVDSLVRVGEITQSQYDRWSNHY